MVDPETWYSPDRQSMGEENYQDFLRAIHNPATVHAMCEDYRAGLGVDRAADNADALSGRRLQCPMLLVRADRDDLGDLYENPAAIWRAWADDVLEAVLDCGHHIAEEAPDELVAELETFLGDPSASQ